MKELLARKIRAAARNYFHGITRAVFLACLYGGVVWIALWIAFLIRFEFQLGSEDRALLWHSCSWIVVVYLSLLFVFGQFRTSLSYFSIPDARRIGASCGISAGIILIVWYWTRGAAAPPRSVILASFVGSALGICLVRLLFRLVRVELHATDRGSEVQTVVLIGAGDVGASIANEMRLRKDLRLRPLAFFDDNKQKWGTYVHGIPVVGRPENIPDEFPQVHKVIITMPSASGRRIREIVTMLNEARLQHEIVPSMQQMVNGTVKVSQIRPVQIEDLLGRDAVNLETGKIREFIQGRVVMVTGAGGSIGSELCRQILAFGPSRLLLVERCEVQLFQIEQELLSTGGGASILALVADILDEPRIQSLVRRFAPKLVFHAAAHKHVPMMEHQPYEALKNNAHGTVRLARICAAEGVSHFVLISTDKAINPTNVMGASKRIAELYLQALQKETPNTRFMAVRFGNVLGSSGSVVPTFRKQIAAGGPVTVTHPEMTRYFMTIPEAVGLVLQSSTLGAGGEIFVLNMGQPVKIVDLARQLIELSGLRPEIDIQIQYSGLRPGEKLYEEIAHRSENVVPCAHPKIYKFVGTPPQLSEIAFGLDSLIQLGSDSEAGFVKREIQRLVPEYKPHLYEV